MRTPTANPWRTAMSIAGSAIVLGGLLSGCAGSDRRAAPATETGACPGPPVAVVVTVDPWSDLAATLGGDCARVDTVLVNPTVDPHDYEPSTGDAARFTGAQVVVQNGAGYDAWATGLVETLDPQPVVVDAGRAAGVAEGANPHLWYSPDYVRSTAEAVTAALRDVAPELDDYWAARAADWRRAVEPYDQRVATVAEQVRGRAYAAVEPVADYLAAALGLRDATPAGWRQAATNESEPAPGDVHAFQELLRDRQVDVLFVNTQTEGAANAAVQQSAQEAGVAVVAFSETVPAGRSYLEWQRGQLDALAEALGAS